MDENAGLTTGRIEYFFRFLSSDKAKVKAIRSLLDSGQKVPEDYVIWALDLLEKDGDFLEAAWFAVSAEKPESALKNFDRTIASYRIKEYGPDMINARLKEAGQVAETAGMGRKAIGYYRRASCHHDAARVAMKMGMVGDAISFYLKSDDQSVLSEGAKLAEQNSMTRDAVSLYVKSHSYADAARVAKNSGHAGTIIEELAEDSNMLVAMARVAKAAELGDKAKALFGRAVDDCLVIEKHDDGAKLAEEGGMPDRAKSIYEGRMEHFEANGDLEKAGKYAEKAGMKEKAKSLFRTVYDILRATHPGIKFCGENHEIFGRMAKCAYRAGLVEDAFSLYAEAARFSRGPSGWLEEGVSIGVKAGMNEKVVQLMLDAQGKEPAAKAAEKLGMYKRAMDLYEDAGNFPDAERVAVSAGDKKRAETYRAFAPRSS